MSKNTAYGNNFGKQYTPDCFMITRFFRMYNMLQTFPNDGFTFQKVQIVKANFHIFSEK